MAKKRKKIFFWIGCFAVPVLLMLAVYIRLGIYPFGSHSLLTSDMSSQYAAFFSAYRRTILEEGGNFLYSFQKSLGGNMLGLFAYYLASPLNVLLLLFPPDSLTEGILCLTLLKLGLSSVSFAYFLRRTFCSRPIHTLLFSWMYALCSYNIVYQQNLMWLDGVIFLPIVIWGLEKIIRGERGCLYSAVLALTLISNYYIGYMICIFCILYFIYRVLLNGKQQNGLRKQMTAFIGHSALSGGISAFLLLPTFADLLISKASEPGTAAHGLKFMPWDLFSKLYIGAFDYTDMQYGLPNIYCGVLAAILLLFYFFNRRILRREKLFSAGLLAVLIISMSADTINRIWHGMQEPIWFPYRYSFILSFLVLCLAYRALVHMEAVEPLPLFGVLSLWVIAGVLAGEKRFISQGQVGITLLFASVYLLILTLYFYSRQHVIIYILTFLVCTELTGNALLSLGRLPYDERAEYSDFIERVGPAVDQYAADGSNTFYRMEKQFRLTKNDPMLLGYPGILHFSSTHQTNVTELARKLGIASSTHNKTMVAYQGSTPVTDMVFGIRYLFSEEPVPGYQPIEEKNGYTVYQNPYALPLGFMVPELPEDLTLDKAYFAHNQQELVRLLTGKKLKLLYRQPEVQKVAEGVYQFEATTYFPVYGQAREVI
ncbi:MAG TPA: YfhO family protein, partial [Firmicutes bacterium]|nr:YfhO family protein [Bacillota bacterium]